MRAHGGRWRGIRSAQLALYERILRLGSRSLTDDELAADALVVSPHPDDETLGCGGTIARKTDAGARVTILYVTDGDASHPELIDPAELAGVRRSEAVAAAAELGVPQEDLVFAGLPDGRVFSAADELAAIVTRCIERVRPRQVLTVCRWEPHHDHGVTADVVARAVAEMSDPPDLFEFPIWIFSTPPWVPLETGRRRDGLRRSVATAPRLATQFRRHVDLGDALDAKRAALRMHVTQTTRYVDDVRWSTLGDVGDGAFLSRLLADREVFAPRRRVTRS